MTLLGLASGHESAGELKLSFRNGWVRTVVLSLGGVGAVGMGAALLELAEHQPVPLFGLLQQWGFWWLLAIVAMLLAWDLLKRAVSYVGKLAESVQDAAVAIGRIAERDDRDRDRMITETAFVGQRIQRLSDVQESFQQEQRQHNARMEALVLKIGDKRGEAGG